jgi:hypothetical protein
MLMVLDYHDDGDANGYDDIVHDVRDDDGDVDVDGGDDHSEDKNCYRVILWRQRMHGII